MKINLVVTDVPFDPTTVDAHLDTSNGTIEIELGHLVKADAKLTTNYETAKSVLLHSELGSAMKNTKIEGNMFKLMPLMSIGKDPSANSLLKELRDITEAQ